MTGPRSERYRERYRDLRVRLPAEEDAASALLREVLAEGERCGWKLVSAIKGPEANVLLVTWDTSESLSGGTQTLRIPTPEVCGNASPEKAASTQ